MITRTVLLHALSPLHAGTGQAAELIDLPIARMKGTGIPLVPGSSIKGVLRDACRPADGASDAEKNKWLSVFGPETDQADEHAGAVVCGDARLLALPVRSFRGTFAYATSPLLLTLARRDLPNGAPLVPDVPAPGALVTAQSALADNDSKIYLEDIDLPARKKDHADDWAAVFAGTFGTEQSVFVHRFAIVDDETMTFLWETATQVDSRVRIDSKTRTVAKRALWMEESLPPETLLIGFLAAEPSRRNGAKLSRDEVLDFVLHNERILQFGGKATVGRGRCRVIGLS